jgi:hypothetical protein
MPIKLNIKQRDQKKVKQLGGPLVYETDDNPVWQKVEDDRLIFAATFHVPCIWTS